MIASISIHFSSGRVFSLCLPVQYIRPRGPWQVSTLCSSTCQCSMRLLVLIFSWQERTCLTIIWLFFFFFWVKDRIDWKCTYTVQFVPWVPLLIPFNSAKETHEHMQVARNFPYTINQLFNLIHCWCMFKNLYLYNIFIKFLHKIFYNNHYYY